MTDTFLLNDFYTVKHREDTGENKFQATVLLNAAHPVFKGHFEQMPVVPGVFQTQLIKELLQEQLQADLWLSKGDNIKFMAMIVPGQHPEINIEISYRKDENKYITEARIFAENTTFTKFKGTFTQH
jgi:3-hydroxyacyl-[acyl-carrier-protein] dehydratase